jgi:salicylate hydroxylase
MEKLEAVKEFTEHINPRENFTTMVMCHDRRLVMGPVRNGESYSVVALLPDGIRASIFRNETLAYFN